MDTKKTSKFLSYVLIEVLKMHNAGATFYKSDYNVWLVEHVPAEFITLFNK